MPKSNWSVVPGEVFGVRYVIVRRGTEDICTAEVTASGSPRGIEFADDRHLKNNRTRQKAVDVLVDHLAGEVRKLEKVGGAA
jgi:hypothetical protein